MAVSANFTNELYKPQTSIALFTLVEITHTQISTIRLVDNNEAITYLTNTYSPMALTFEMPSESGELVTNASLQIDNIDRTVILALRTITTTERPEVTVTIISDLNGTITKERGPYTFILKDIAYDLYSIKLSLSYNDELTYAFPTISMTPENCPALFR